MLTPVIVHTPGIVIYMVEIKISEKTIKFKSYSSKSHLKTSNLIPLEKLEIDTSGKLTRWYLIMSIRVELIIYKHYVLNVISVFFL
jgi:hypothetical protein